MMDYTGLIDSVLRAYLKPATAPERMVSGLLGAPDMVKGMAQSAYSGATLPGDVVTGKTDPTSPEGFARVQDLAGLLGGSGYATEKPAGAIGMFAGRTAKTADLNALAQAEKMAAAGESKVSIRDATGWFPGKDGQWRFEIPDDSSVFHHLRMPKAPDRWEIAKQYFEQQGVPRTKISTGQFPTLDQEAFQYADHQIARGIKPEVRMAGLLDHPLLYDAYPEAASIPVSAETAQVLNGTFNPASNSISIAGPKSITEKLSETAARQHSTALHELQHFIQQREGFAPGANVSQFEGMYDHVPDAQVIRTLMNRKGLQPSDAIKEFEAIAGRPASFQSKDLASSVTRDVFKIPSSAEQAYKWSAGEVEARNVQKRMRMTPYERRQIAPWETQDITPDLQIVPQR